MRVENKFFADFLKTNPFVPQKTFWMLLYMNIQNFLVLFCIKIKLYSVSKMSESWFSPTTGFRIWRMNGLVRSCLPLNSNVTGQKTQGIKFCHMLGSPRNRCWNEGELAGCLFVSTLGFSVYRRQGKEAGWGRGRSWTAMHSNLSLSHREIWSYGGPAELSQVGQGS